MIKEKYDVIIVGGGASGLCCAVKLKSENRNLSVAILEQLPRVGKKLITTGNGRCNITNADESDTRFHSDDRQFVTYALETYNNTVIENFFNNIGVTFTYDDEGRAYPYSLQAASVVDALRFAVEKSGVSIFTETKVLSFDSENGIYAVYTDKGEFSAETLIIASGLYSGGEKLGSSGRVFEIMRDMGYKTSRVTPAIVQLKTNTDIVRQLKGVKINASVKLLNDKKILRTEYGEVLFCDYGLSGPPIMQVSRFVGREKGKITVNLDIMPEYDFDRVCEMIRERVSLLGDRNFDEFFTGLLNKRVGQIIVKMAGKKLSDIVSVSDADIKTMAALIKNLPFEVMGTTGFLNSQVTAGGLLTSQFDMKSMKSNKNHRLYCIGEILDVDGDCGGFNLHWAWSSAMCAADSVIRFRRKDK